MNFRKYLIPVVILLLCNNKILSQNRPINLINKINFILDTLTVSINLFNLYDESNTKLETFAHSYTEYNALTNKYDTLQSNPVFKIGTIMKCTKVSLKNDMMVIELAGKPEFNGLVMPVDIFLHSIHEEKNLTTDLIAKIGFIANIPLNKVILNIKSINVNYAILFDDEILIVDFDGDYKKLPNLKYEATPLFDFLKSYGPHANDIALLFLQREIGIKMPDQNASDVNSYTKEKPLTTIERRKIKDSVKIKIENFMSLKYKRKYGDRFLSDGVSKFTLNSVKGEITKKPNIWEVVDFIIYYVPSTKNYGELSITFNGIYQTASPKGNVKAEIIRAGSPSLETEYSYQINDYLNNLFKEIQNLLFYERK